MRINPPIIFQNTYTRLVRNILFNFFSPSKPICLNVDIGATAATSAMVRYSTSASAYFVEAYVHGPSRRILYLEIS